ncbi:23S rRNA m(1)G-748 methyltransferase [Nakamurella panacisegetis]|uniref:23S rRNA m(1)G-748 methyltransferase n=1 Tax=Nakamurella panacisegetis TaxID=1090615 RepID=A0A1H0N8L9_9ACTN|nr:hypothetical protein [Nakamurella panacisegetis]SDO89023.1 23S rRNA m(1)G-748 methyltransferase [Nakamurella panacisegetis]
MKPGHVRAAALHHVRHPTHRYPPAAVAALACPHCGTGLTCDDDTFTCQNGHTFDIARQGYVALLAARARTDTGDSSDMVTAREQFLGAGHYAPIAAALGPVSGPVLEIGAGTGYYLSAVLDAGATGDVAGATGDLAGATGDLAGAKVGIALDSSKFAARRAAHDRRVLSVVADAWSSLPIRSESLGAVLSVFAPRDPSEVRRVLRPGGRLIAVTPNPKHLGELRDRIDMLTVDEGKADRLVAAFDGLLTPVGHRVVEFAMSLTRADVSALVRMGPSARHLTADGLAARVEALPEPLPVTATVTVSTFEKPAGR